MITRLPANSSESLVRRNYINFSSILKSSQIQRKNFSFSSVTLMKNDEIKVKKSSNIVTQQDLDKINRQHINRIQQDIQKSAEADLFGTARAFFKAIVIGFFSATIAAILYGYKEPAYRKQLKTR